VTCIAAVRTPQGVVMGGDSQGLAGYAQTARLDPKVFTRRYEGSRSTPTLLFGYTTSYRFGQLVRFDMPVKELFGRKDGRYWLSAPTREQTQWLADSGAHEQALRWGVRKLVPAMRKALRDGGYSKVENSVESGGSMLVGVGCHLIGVSDDFQVWVPEDGFDAVGCGHDIARGAMHALERTWGDLPDPARMVTIAIEAAIRFSSGVGGRIDLVTNVPTGED
jgi:ATP-dependent protease HslVU (ClpYQ) peptidase subunit